MFFSLEKVNVQRVICPQEESQEEKTWLQIDDYFVLGDELKLKFLVQLLYCLNPHINFGAPTSPKLKKSPISKKEVSIEFDLK